MGGGMGENAWGAKCVVFGKEQQSVQTHIFIELYLKGLTISNVWRPYVGFKIERRTKQIPRWYSECDPKKSMLELSLLRACLERDWMDIHVYLQNIIIMKRRNDTRFDQDEVKRVKFKLINTHMVDDVPRGIKWSRGMASNCKLRYVN
jgi:hypothetical protein